MKAACLVGVLSSMFAIGTAGWGQVADRVPLCQAARGPAAPTGLRIVMDGGNAAPPVQTAPAPGAEDVSGKTVRFRNVTESPVTMYFVNAQGVENPLPSTEIPSGGEYTQADTKAGQRWRFRQGPRVVAQYVVGANPQQFVDITVPILPGNSQYQVWLFQDQPSILPKYEPLREEQLGAANNSPAGMGEFMERGYHVLRMNPMNLIENGADPSARVFARQTLGSRDLHPEAGYLVPNRYMASTVAETEGSEATSTFFSSAERMNSFGANVSVGGGFMGIKAGSKFGFSQQTTSTSALDRTSFMSVRWGADSSLTLIKRELKLDPSFIADVERLDGGDDCYRAFFARYGTHYALRMLFGGIAFYEKTYNADEVGQAITKSLSASNSASVDIKQADVSREIGFTISKSESNVQKTSTENARYWALGGTVGNSFDSWALGEETRNYVGIKVDLRPIWELIWPLTMGNIDVTQANRTLERQAGLRSAWERYLADEQRTIAESASSRPRMFSVNIDAIRVAKDDDTGTDGPDLWGYVSLYALNGSRNIPFLNRDPRVCVRSLSIEPAGQNPALGCDRWKNFGSSLEDTLDHRDTISIRGEFPDVDKRPLTIAIAPRVTRTEQDGQVRFQANYDLNQYRLYPLGYLRDDDDGGANADDWLTLDGRPSAPSLQDVANRGGAITATATQSAQGLGSIEVTYTIREINYRIEPSQLNLPEFPAFQTGNRE
jgi:hypothetical protein